MMVSVFVDFEVDCLMKKIVLFVKAKWVCWCHPYIHRGSTNSLIPSSTVYHLFFIDSVPVPQVTVTLSHATTLYTGINLTFTCTVILDPNVDNDERVVTKWSGLQDIPEERYSVTAASGSGSTYTGSLTISPLAYQNTGTYTCTGTVNGSFHQATANASDDISINVNGKLCSHTTHTKMLHTFIVGIFYFNVTSQFTSLIFMWDFQLTSKTVSTYSISYSNSNNTQCFTDSNDISGISSSETMYNLTGLQEATEYSITVTAILSDGETAVDSVTATTLPAG